MCKVFLAILCYFFTACGTILPENFVCTETTYFNYEGRVYNSNGEPITRIDLIVSKEYYSEIDYDTLDFTNIHDLGFGLKSLNGSSILKGDFYTSTIEEFFSDCSDEVIDNQPLEYFVVGYLCEGDDWEFVIHKRSKEMTYSEGINKIPNIVIKTECVSYNQYFEAD